MNFSRYKKYTGWELNVGDIISEMATGNEYIYTVMDKSDTELRIFTRVRRGNIIEVRSQEEWHDIDQPYFWCVEVSPEREWRFYLKDYDEFPKDLFEI